MPGTFDVDHLNMNVGIYCPGVDSFGDKEIYTLDVRTMIPYKEKVLTNKEMHTVEHILAVEIAKACEEDGKVSKIYWGPMGCSTGFYLLVAVPKDIENPSARICSVLRDACRQVIVNPYYPTPANSIKECGNYKTLYSTADEVKWVLERIYYSCERVIIKNEFDKYIFIEN